MKRPDSGLGDAIKPWHPSAMGRRDGIGLAAAAGVLGLMLLFRHLYVEPREWGALCLAATPPLACGPRAALLWLQHWQLWGGGAVLLGLWAFLGGPFWVRVAAVALGAVATANYNATWGMLGLLLGAWAWIGAAGGQRRSPAGHGSGLTRSIHPASLGRPDAILRRRRGCRPVGRTRRRPRPEPS